jgi:hypothetical protein
MDKPSPKQPVVLEKLKNQGRESETLAACLMRMLSQ